jgi:PKD repeat protein
VLAIAAAVPLGGCEKLCDAGAVTWCPRAEGDRLNDPPEVGELIQVESSSPRRGRVPPTRRAGIAVVDWATILRLDSGRDPDGDPLLFEWDLDGDGTFEAGGTGLGEQWADPGFVPGLLVRKVYRAPADLRVAVRVSDFPCNLGAPGEVTRTRRLAVVELDGNRPPVAGFTVSPSPATAGESVRFDAESAYDPDWWDEAAFPALPTPYLDSLQYDWSFGDGHGSPLPDRHAAVSHAYTAAGTYTVKLDLRDLLGAHATLERTLVVQDNPSAPTARFTITPNPARAGQEVTFDGSASSDPDGPIVRYEWEIFHRGITRRPEGPVYTTRFETEGQATATLRVTDSEGTVDSETQTFPVLPPASSLATGAVRGSAAAGTCSTPTAGKAARPGRATTTEFSAMVGGRPLRAGRGVLHRRGALVSLRGAAAAGRLRLRLLGGPARGSRALRLLRRFLGARLRTRASVAFDRRGARLTARATALARLPRARRHSACLHTWVTIRPGRRPRGRLEILGGRGAGARLRGAGSFQFRLDRDGTATVLGRMRARTGPRRPLPRSCRQLTSSALK